MADLGFGAMRTDIDADLTRDQQLLSRLPVTQPLRYQQTSTLRDAYPAVAAASSSATYGTISSCRARRRANPKTIQFAHELRKHASRRHGYIEAVLEWFHREPFFYTLAPPLLGADPVDGFLFETRRGFCEHYASAFVVMLRAAGFRRVW
jgi:transglutaminase-like putative cysteine protease